MASAQSAAMGGSALALSGDSAAMFSNPAGLAGLGGAETYFSYDSLMPGVLGAAGPQAGFAAAGVPTRLGVIGLGAGGFNAPGLMLERTIAVSLAESLFGGALRLGVTGKQLYHSYSPDAASAQNSVFRNGTSKSAFALDAGAAVSVWNSLTFGLAIGNINRPDVGLGSEDRVSRRVQAEAALNLAAPGLLLTGNLSIFNGGLGASADGWAPGLGVEKGLYGNRILLRAGAGTQEFSAGLGLQLGNLGFDYAFRINRALSQDYRGAHVVGLRLKFGPSPEADVK